MRALVVAAAMAVAALTIGGSTTAATLVDVEETPSVVITGAGPPSEAPAPEDAATDATEPESPEPDSTEPDSPAPDSPDPESPASEPAPEPIDIDETAEPEAAKPTTGEVAP
jgi:hypothetical protein